MDYTEDTDAFLAHFGVKGMRWGVRKSHETVSLVNAATGNSHDIHYDPRKATVTKTADGHVSLKSEHKRELKSIQDQIDNAVKNDPHPDAAKVKEVRRVAKASGTSALSNQDLKKLVERMNLEQQYDKLNPKQVSAGKKFVNGTGKLVGKSFLGAAQGTSNQAAKTVTNVGIKLAFAAFMNGRKRGAKNGGTYSIIRDAIAAS